MSISPDPSAVRWFTSSLSGSNDESRCVEVAHLPDGTTAVRDSKHREGPVLLFAREEWEAFLGGVRRGEFDR